MNIGNTPSRHNCTAREIYNANRRARLTYERELSRVDGSPACMVGRTIENPSEVLDIGLNVGTITSPKREPIG